MTLDAKQMILDHIELMDKQINRASHFGSVGAEILQAKSLALIALSNLPTETIGGAFEFEDMEG